MQLNRERGKGEREREGERQLSNSYNLWADTEKGREGRKEELLSGGAREVPSILRFALLQCRSDIRP